MRYVNDYEATLVAGAKLAEATVGDRELRCRPALPRWLNYRGSAASVSCGQNADKARLCPSHRVRAGQRPPYLLLLAVILVALMVGDALACPMCKAALGSHDSGHGDLVGGFFWSILFMLSMPFLIFGSLSTYMYMLVRRARREQAERKAAPVLVEAFANDSMNDRLAEPVTSERLYTARGLK